MENIKTQVVVIGAGPAGYSAAFRSADLGFEVVLVEKYATLGGVCLNVGCIPSKALLHMAKVIKESKEVASHGIGFGELKIDLEGLRKYKNGVVKKLTDGLSGMAKMRKVKVIQGIANFTSKNSLEVASEGGKTIVEFDNAIIAAGSRPIELPFIPHEDKRVWDSTDALELKEVPQNLLIMGGGIIGLEMGTVYKQLGSNIDVVEMMDQIVPVADKDVVKAYSKANNKEFNIMLQTKVTKVEAKETIEVTMESKDGKTFTNNYDAILVAIGRSANGKMLGLENAGVNVDERGIIAVDKQMRTNVENIFAVGDIVGQPMLAHKGVHEAHIAAEVIAGYKHFFEPKTIPSIAYTFPEMAWAGLTEKEAKESGIDYEVATFPWSASGRAIASGVSENGFTKLIFDKGDNRIIGGAIVGDNAGELLGEICLGLEMDCDAEDIGLTIHAHPTLHESIGMAAEIYDGTITDLPNKKAKKAK
jgi:dihydrolipoamide dehydrogenase